MRRIRHDLIDSYDEEQDLRFPSRIHDPLDQCKLRPVSLKSRRRWEKHTKAKEIKLERRHIPAARWWVVQAVEKKKARLNCIHDLLQQMPCQETAHLQLVLPERIRQEDDVRHPVSTDFVVSQVY